MDLDYDETFNFEIKPNNIITKNNFYYSYICGFLSRIYLINYLKIIFIFLIILN